MTNFDAIVIGSGQSGTPLSKELARAGMRTALIEKKYVGGCCVNYGCTPTKAMISSAKTAYNVTHSEGWGVDVRSYAVDFKKIISRKNRIVESFRESAREGLEKTEGLTFIPGEAAFVEHKVIAVKSENGKATLTADKIFIDAGLHPPIPPLDGINNVPYFTSTTLLDIVTLPTHLLILGGGYLGLEFAQMFKRFGSEVTVIESAPRLLPKEDDDISKQVQEILEDEGIRIYTGMETEKVAHNHRIELTVHTDQEKQIISGSHFLVAVGRVPQTEALHLDKTGVETDEKGFIKVNDQLETNIPGIYALGDIKGGPAFTHISYNDYIVVSQNLLEGKQISIANRQVPYCMFTDPQLGRIGLTEREAREKGLEIKVAKLPMSKTSRGVETNHTRGLMKAIVEKSSGKILGAAILAEEGGEIMSVLQMAMKAGFTAEEIRNQIFAHPLYAESLNNLFMTI